MNKQTFSVTDAHPKSFEAMLAEGKSIETEYPIAFASRATNTSEKKCLQIDLEAIDILFTLRCFQNYILESSERVAVVTDHQSSFLFIQ